MQPIRRYINRAKSGKENPWFELIAAQLVGKTCFWSLKVDVGPIQLDSIRKNQIIWPGCAIPYLPYTIVFSDIYFDLYTIYINQSMLYAVHTITFTHVQPSIYVRIFWATCSDLSRGHPKWCLVGEYHQNSFNSGFRNWNNFPMYIYIYPSPRILVTRSIITYTVIYFVGNLRG